MKYSENSKRYGGEDDSEARALKPLNTVVAGAFFGYD